MNKNWLHKSIAIVFLSILLFPFMVQASHAIERHEHKVCKAVDTKHFHNIEMDCCICHFQVKHDTFYALPEFKIIEQITFNDPVFSVISDEFASITNQKSPRGPPYFFFV